MQGINGSFYGTTVTGGVNGRGTVFAISSTGAIQALYSFCTLTNCADGSNPYGNLILATDGNLYGTAPAGGINQAGTVFKFTMKGALTTIYDFCSRPNCADGRAPSGGLVEASDLNFYGMAMVAASILVAAQSSGSHARVI